MIANIDTVVVVDIPPYHTAPTENTGGGYNEKTLVNPQNLVILCNILNEHREETYNPATNSFYPEEDECPTMGFKRSLIALCLIFFCLTETGSAVVIVSGVIPADTTWTSTDTILVTGSVTVADSVRLTIQAGAIILFANNTGLFVEGELMADGEKTSRIHFTTSADTSGGSPVAGSWYGLNFPQYSTGILYYCNLRYPVTGITVSRTSCSFHDCVIENFQAQGYKIDGYQILPLMPVVIAGGVVHQVEGSLLGTGTGIFVYQSVDVSISDCMVSGCDVGLDFLGQGTYAPQYQVSGCEIRDHATRGIYSHSGG